MTCLFRAEELRQFITEDLIDGSIQLHRFVNQFITIAYSNFLILQFVFKYQLKSIMRKIQIVMSALYILDLKSFFYSWVIVVPSSIGSLISCQPTFLIFVIDLRLIVIIFTYYPHIYVIIVGQQLYMVPAAYQPSRYAQCKSHPQESNVHFVIMVLSNNQLLCYFDTNHRKLKIKSYINLSILCLGPNYSYYFLIKFNINTIKIHFNFYFLNMHIDRDAAYSFYSPNQKLNLPDDIDQVSKSGRKGLGFQNTLPHSRYSVQPQQINSNRRIPQQNTFSRYLSPNNRQTYNSMTNPPLNNNKIVKPCRNVSAGMTDRSMPVYQHRPQSTKIYRPLSVISPVKTQVVNLLPLKTAVIVPRNYIPVIPLPNNTYFRPYHQVICRNFIKNKICSNSFCPYQLGNQKNQLIFVSDLELRYRNVMGKNSVLSRHKYDLQNYQSDNNMVYNKYNSDFKPANKSTFNSISQYNPEIIANIKNMIKQDGVQTKYQSGPAMHKPARNNISSFRKKVEHEPQNLKKQQDILKQRLDRRHPISDVNSKNEKESMTHQLDYRNILNSDQKKLKSQLQDQKLNSQWQNYLNQASNKKQLSKDTKIRQEQPQNKRNTKKKHK